MRVSQADENQKRPSNHQPKTAPRAQKTQRLDRRFPKSARLLHRAQFQGVIHSGRKFVGAIISIDYRQSRGVSTRLGITVSKKFGKAHDRNRFKRVVREVFRETRHLLPLDLDINVCPKKAPVVPLTKGSVSNDWIAFTSHLTKRARHEPQRSPEKSG